MAVIHWNEFISDLYHEGVDISMDEVEQLVDSGILPVDAQGYLITPQCFKAFNAWTKAGKPAPNYSGRNIVDVKPPPRRFETISAPGETTTRSGGSSDPDDKLLQFVREMMGKDPNLSYGQALSAVQKEHPNLAIQVAKALDGFRGRNKKARTEV